MEVEMEEKVAALEIPLTDLQWTNISDNSTSWHVMLKAQ